MTENILIKYVRRQTSSDKELLHTGVMKLGSSVISVNMILRDLNPQESLSIIFYIPEKSSNCEAVVACQVLHSSVW